VADAPPLRGPTLACPARQRLRAHNRMTCCCDYCSDFRSTRAPASAHPRSALHFLGKCIAILERLAELPFSVAAKRQDRGLRRQKRRARRGNREIRPLLSAPDREGPRGIFFRSSRTLARSAGASRSAHRYSVPMVLDSASSRFLRWSRRLMAIEKLKPTSRLSSVNVAVRITPKSLRLSWSNALPRLRRAPSHGASQRPPSVQCR
jgi:hypothetical protein